MKTRTKALGPEHKSTLSSIDMVGDALTGFDRIWEGAGGRPLQYADEYVESLAHFKEAG